MTGFILILPALIVGYLIGVRVERTRNKVKNIINK